MPRKGPDVGIRLRRTKATGNGYYEASKAAGGKRVTKTFPFRPGHELELEDPVARRAAMLWRLDRERDANAGRLGLPPRAHPITVGEAMDEFLVYLEGRRGEWTVYYYRTNFNAWRDLRERPLASVTSEELADKLAEEVAAKKSRRTVQIHRQVLSALFNWARAKQRRYIPANPLHEVNMREILPAKRKRKPPRALRLHELQLFLRAARSRYRLLFRCLAFLGLRRAELYRLRWDWIDWVSGELHIPDVTDEGGKTGADVVSIPQVLLDELEAEHQVRLAAATKAKPLVPFLFSKTGKWRASHREQLERTCTRAKISAVGVGYHCLRHSMATLIYREGGNDAALAAKFLRHSTEGKESTWLYVHSDRELDLLPVIERVVTQVDGDLVAIPMRAGARR